MLLKCLLRPCGKFFRKLFLRWTLSSLQKNPQRQNPASLSGPPLSSSGLGSFSRVASLHLRRRNLLLHRSRQEVKVQNLSVLRQGARCNRQTKQLRTSSSRGAQMLPPWSRSALTARSRSSASACSSAPPEVTRFIYTYSPLRLAVLRFCMFCLYELCCTATFVEYLAFLFFDASIPTVH